ncbi:pass1 domain protein [Asticcacaulis biprosthecium C19]|uniref:Pass1 domain protein n=1 Tax=Asticcacaulis biprosthecium C19 TaxID=715226 RepID=F4QP48_9CAUL|nr:cupin-like domain-containing protein [Asticcacaulis biprosthecium]EGF91106.1 pass1 domain protein [Asticcacaulis biprosthecium C19]
MSAGRIAEITGIDLDTFKREVAPGDRPVVLRGTVADWPSVQAAQQSDEAFARYLTRFYNGSPVHLMLGPPEIDGRLFMTPDLRGLNFDVRQGDFAQTLDALLRLRDAPRPPAIYMGAATVSGFLPGFTADNSLSLVAPDLVPNLWLGNRITVGPHNDIPDNIACVVAGRRRFRLFPPDQYGNLYVGPLELTPAGRPASLVDVRAPDLERFPRYAEALAASQVAELEPGDALFIPSMWWHSVESLTPFNALVNYWWPASPKDAAAPEAALIHALMTLADLPKRQRDAWKSVFDHHVFRDSSDPVEHIAPHARGLLGPRTPDTVDAMRELIRRSLNR